MFNCLFTLENHLDLRCVLQLTLPNKTKPVVDGAESQFFMNRLI